MTDTRHNFSKPENQPRKEVLFEKGKFYLKVPPKNMDGWNTDDWIRYIDRHGYWLGTGSF